MTLRASVTPGRISSAPGAAGSDVALRPVAPSDDAFLRQVYAGTREDELLLTGWDDATKGAFLHMQFEAQRRSYLEQFPRAQYDVILRGHQPAGRLIVNRALDQMTIVDIAVVPEHRGAGIGTIVLSRLIDEACDEGLPVQIYVEHANRAIRLYDRLGFRVIDDVGFYFRMERPARSESEPPARGECHGNSVRR